jgi:hypothetical protein
MPQDGVAGSDAQHQQPEVAKKKRHEAVFFVKQARLEGTGNPSLPRKVRRQCPTI